MAKSKRGTYVINQGQGSCLSSHGEKLRVGLELQVIRERFGQGMPTSSRQVSWAQVMDVTQSQRGMLMRSKVLWLTATREDLALVGAH